MLHAATLRIVRTEHHPPDAEEARRLSTHRTGLQGYDEVAIRQPRLATDGSRCPQRQKFRVRRGVGSRLHFISCLR